jgi:hypothetical protein
MELVGWVWFGLVGSVLVCLFGWFGFDWFGWFVDCVGWLG